MIDTNAYMKKVIARKGTPVTLASPTQENPFTEFDKFLYGPTLDESECDNLVAWWGVRVLLWCGMYIKPPISVSSAGD